MGDGRRPLAVRGTAAAQAVARWLTTQGVAPDTISKASLLFALCAFGLFWGSAGAGDAGQSLLLVAAAVSIQLRLLCNLFDGMVAVEGGRGGPEGPFWNEIPDRPADLLILTGAGLACGQLTLGLLAGALALLTAYIRAISVALGQGPDFSGPFAKQQRMAAITLGALVAAIEAWLFATTWALTTALGLTALGTAWTALRRARTLRRALVKDETVYSGSRKS